MCFINSWGFWLGRSQMLELISGKTIIHKKVKMLAPLITAAQKYRRHNKNIYLLFWRRWSPVYSIICCSKFASINCCPLYPGWNAINPAPIPFLHSELHFWPMRYCWVAIMIRQLDRPDSKSILFHVVFASIPAIEITNQLRSPAA